MSEPKLDAEIDVRPERQPKLPVAIDPNIVEALDQAILSVLDGDWHKVAIVIARVTDTAKTQALDVSAQAIAQRIYALADDKRLEVQGNVRRWRAGEVRLKIVPAT